jgi:hypothetical protein
MDGNVKLQVTYGVVHAVIPFFKVGLDPIMFV